MLKGQKENFGPKMAKNGLIGSIVDFTSQVFP
jgi:hypothetical protein